MTEPEYCGNCKKEMIGGVILLDLDMTVCLECWANKSYHKSEPDRVKGEKHG